MASIEARIIDGHIEATLDGDGQELIALMGYVVHSVTDALDMDVFSAMLATAMGVEDMRKEGKWETKEGEDYGEYLHQQ